MSLKDIIAKDIAVFLNTNEFAETGSYNGNSLTIAKILSETGVNGNYYVSEGQTDQVTILVAIFDIPELKKGSIITDADGNNWRVERIRPSIPGMCELECYSNDTASPFGGR